MTAEEVKVVASRLKNITKNETGKNETGWPLQQNQECFCAKAELEEA